MEMFDNIMFKGNPHGFYHCSKSHSSMASPPSITCTISLSGVIFVRRTSASTNSSSRPYKQNSIQNPDNHETCLITLKVDKSENTNQSF